MILKRQKKICKNPLKAQHPVLTCPTLRQCLHQTASLSLNFSRRNVIGMAPWSRSALRPDTPWDAEQVVQRSAELLHAGLIWIEGNGQDQTAAPVFASFKRQDAVRFVAQKSPAHLPLLCYLTERPASSWGWGGWLSLPCWQQTSRNKKNVLLLLFFWHFSFQTHQKAQTLVLSFKE